MTCDLSEGELVILYKLARNLSFTRDTAYNSKLLKKIYDKGDYEILYKKVMQKLNREGYVTKTKKKAGLKYYISDRKGTLIALGEHGYAVPRGRTRPIE